MISQGFILILFLSFVSIEAILKLVDPTKAKLVFYYGPDATSSTVYNISDAPSVLDNPQFVHNETHCYFHGYNESLTANTVLTIRNAYQYREINLLIINYAPLVDADYVSAVINAKNLAPLLSSMFLNLFTAGLPENSLTLVGHSLGGQLVGLIGRKYIQLTNGNKLNIIWALDPAFPGYLDQNLVSDFQTVGANAANTVYIIHTGAPNFGQFPPTGDVDFYPNGGVQGQPGCPSGIIIPFSAADLCSHQISVQYWAESIQDFNGPYFYAFPTNFPLFTLTNYDESKAIIMGPECPPSARGTYYLKTNPNFPRAKGLDGY